MNATFVHAVYGVRLSEEELAVVNAATAEVALLRATQMLNGDEAEEDAPFDLENAVLAHLAATQPNFVPELRRKYGSGTVATLHFTGDEDDRLRGCQTESDAWLFGYGLFAFPGTVVPAKFYENAYWHTWATG